MEKYIRLLNAKTVNYEAIRVDNASASLTSQDVILAMSFAKLTPLQNNLIRLKCFNANSIQNIEKLSIALFKRYESKLGIENEDRVMTCIRVALIEFCAVAGDYKPSTRNRAVLAGVNHLVIHRTLGDAIDQVLRDLNEQYSLASDAVLFQLNKTN